MPLASTLTHCDAQSSNSLKNFYRVRSQVQKHIALESFNDVQGSLASLHSGLLRGLSLGLGSDCVSFHVVEHLLF
jgi:hypothetical protein